MTSQRGDNRSRPAADDGHHPGAGAARNPAALEADVRRHWGAVFGRCRLLTTDDAEAHALALEVFGQLATGHIQPEPGTTTRDRLIGLATTLWRGRHGLPQPANRAAAGHVAPSALLPVVRASAASIDAALGDMSPRLRDVLVSHCIDGEPLPSIARRHDVPHATVEGWLERAAATLRDAAGERPGPDDAG